MIVLLQVGLEENGPCFDLQCKAIYPLPSKVHIISRHEYAPYDIFVCVDKMEFMAITTDGDIWIDEIPYHVKKFGTLLMVLVNQDGILVNQNEINPAKEPMGIC